MADDYQELDVFGRPKSKVEGVPYVLSGADPGAEDAALIDYASGLRNEELPGFVHNYIPGSAASEWERQNPIRLFPGLDRTPIELADWDTIKNRIFGPRQGQTVNTLGRSVRMPARATFDERFGIEPTERAQMWPEKMLRSGASLPADVMEGRVRADFSRPGDFSDDPNAPNPLASLIERTQDLAGLAAGGSVTGVATEGTARAPKPAIRRVKDTHNASADVIGGEAEVRPARNGKGWEIWNSDTNELWITQAGKGMSKADAQWQADMINKSKSDRAIRLNSDDELGTAISGLQGRKDLTEGSFGGNVPPSIARNIGRETMPEILSRQRASEGYEAAIRDPETKKLYTGMWHEEVLDKIAKDRGIPKDQLPANLRKGYVDYDGKFWTEQQVENKSRSRTAMFRADDEVGAAVAAMNASGHPDIGHLASLPFDEFKAAVKRGRISPPYDSEGRIARPAVEVRAGMLRGHDQGLNYGYKTDDIAKFLTHAHLLNTDKTYSRKVSDLADKLGDHNQAVRQLVTDDQIKSAYDEFQKEHKKFGLAKLATLELKPAEAAPAGNLPAVIPPHGVAAPGSAINPISNRRGFLRGARDLMAAASNANKIVTMAEKLGKPAEMPIPKHPKVPLKEIWKREIDEFDEPSLENAHDHAFEVLGDEFDTKNKNVDYNRLFNKQKEAHDLARDDFITNHPDYRSVVDDYLGDNGDMVEGGTAFSHYQLPGATNYREHLMQMPEQRAAVDEQMKHWHDTYRQIHDRDPSQEAVANARKGFAEDTNSGAIKGREPFYGSFDEPDIIGHTRVNDRTLKGGEKSLHVEEAGSELHEAGKKAGYGVKNDKVQTRIKDLDKLMVERQKELWNGLKVKNRPNQDKAVINDPVFQKYREEYNSIYDQRNPVPDLPFKSTHMDLSVNRMLHEAATQGYDALSWTPHDLQKKLYGNDSNKDFHARIEAIAKKYGGKIEKEELDTGKSADFNKWAKMSLKERQAAGVQDSYSKLLDEGHDKAGGQYIYHLKLTPEMKRIFGHDDFSFFPKQATAEEGTGFKLRSDSEAGAAVGALRNSGPAPTFYSGLARTLERAPFEEATPSQWAKYLRDTVGARQAEEFEHVGLVDKVGKLEEEKKAVKRPAQGALDAWKTANPKQRPPKELMDAASTENKRIIEQKLKDRDTDKPLTKKELLEHVGDNQPKFKEIVKKGKGGGLEDRLRNEAHEQAYNERPRRVGEDEHDWHDAVAELADEIYDSRAEQRGGQAKYSDYQLPGGTNYREHLMTMPSKIKPFEEWSKERGYGDHEGARNLYNDIVSGKKEDSASSDVHRSSHWDEPNVIVHTRMNDRGLQDTGFMVKNTKSGNRSQVFKTREEAEKFLGTLPLKELGIVESQYPVKSLHAEEFQSDLHQEGRKHGYRNNNQELAQQKRREAVEQQATEYKRLMDKHPGVSGIEQERIFDVDARYVAASRAVVEAERAVTNPRTVPDFPFKKSWPDLAIKRWLREAVDNDYDAVSWTPGEAQRDRFQLGHTIEKLYYDKLPNGDYLIGGEHKNGAEQPVNRGLPVKDKDLPQHVGEAIAEKIRKGEGRGDAAGIRTLENQDLKVGGEGLVSFYDKTVKAKVQALVEKHGGKVEKHENKRDINIKPMDNGKFAVYDGEKPIDAHLTKEGAERVAARLKNNDDAKFVWSVKLTPELKRAIRSEGFPLFSSGLPLVPVDHDPFDKKEAKKPRLEPVEHDPFAIPTPDMGGALNKLVSEGYRPKPRPIQNGFGVRNEGRQ